MSQKVQIIISIDKELKKFAQNKCKHQFGIGLSPLIKIFLKSFVTQKGVGFYVGDDDLCRLFSQWLSKKTMEMNRKGCAPLPGPRLKDMYDMKVFYE